MKSSVDTETSKSQPDIMLEISRKTREIIQKRRLTGNRMGIDDEGVNTNLISKHYSPMFIRKCNVINGWPLYVGMICDEDVSDLDSVINGVVHGCKEVGLISNNIQRMRNFTGVLSEIIVDYYNGKKENCVEGVAVTLYVDKCFIQGFYGDFMNHLSCRMEFTNALNMLPHV